MSKEDVVHVHNGIYNSALRTKNAGEDAEKGEPSYTAGGNVSQFNHGGKQYGGSSKI